MLIKVKKEKTDNLIMKNTTRKITMKNMNCNHLNESVE